MGKIIDDGSKFPSVIVLFLLNVQFILFRLEQSDPNNGSVFSFLQEREIKSNIFVLEYLISDIMVRSQDLTIIENIGPNQ